MLGFSNGTRAALERALSHGLVPFFPYIMVSADPGSRLVMGEGKDILSFRDEAFTGHVRWAAPGWTKVVVSTFDFHEVLGFVFKGLEVRLMCV